MNRIAIAAISPILVLFLLILRAWLPLALWKRKSIAILGILLLIPAIGRAQDIQPTEQTSDGGANWEPYGTTHSSSTESSSSGSSSGGSAPSYSGQSAGVSSTEQLESQMADAIGEKFNWSAGIPYLEKLAQIDPQKYTPQLVSLKAAVAVDNKDWMSAIFYNEKFLGIPGRPQEATDLAHFTIAYAKGRLAAGKGDWDSAIRAYQEATAYDARYGRNKWGIMYAAKVGLASAMGNIATGKGDWDSATRYFREGLRNAERPISGNVFIVGFAMSPAMIAQYREDVNHIRGDLAYIASQKSRTNDSKASIKYAKEALKYYPSDPIFRENLNNALSGVVKTPSTVAVASPPTSDHSIVTTNKKSSNKSSLPLEAFSQSERRTTGPASQREKTVGHNRRAGDQLVSANAAGQNAGKVFDEGTAQNAGHLDPVKITGTSSGHPEISAVPDKYKKNPTKYAAIMAYDHEARDSAAKVEKLKQDLATLEQTAPTAKDRGKTEVKRVEIKTELQITESRRDAAELNKRDKMRQFAKEAGLE
jgi:tetratricopeptide (TPR) repeat protein